MGFSINKIKKQPTSVIVLIVMIMLTLLFYNFFRSWKFTQPFKSDCNQYYSYLVAFFIHNDLSFSFSNNYWLIKGPLGIPIAKTSLGVALVETPFFLLGHFIAKVGGFSTDGYSVPYALSMNLGALVYVLIGLNYLRKSLLVFYKEFEVSLTIIGLFLGTNLFYYSIGMPIMSHSFLFWLFSVLIYNTIKWHKNGKFIHLCLGVLTCGFVTSVRPSHAIVFLIPILYGVFSWTTFVEKIKLIISLKSKLILVIIIFLLPILPQLLYWKIYTGSWFYFSYTKEGFFWGDPQIWEVLFSYRKGWFLYTPLMLLSIVGMFFYNTKELKFITWVYFLIGLYILSSWWCWWYGGSYGARALIDFYPLLGFPLCFVFQKFSKNIKWRVSGGMILTVFVAWNIIGTIKYNRMINHWDSMTKESFWYGFNKISLTKEERAIFNSLLKEPNYDGALKGERDIP